MCKRRASATWTETTGTADFTLIPKMQVKLLVMQYLLRLDENVAVQEGGE